MYIYIYIHIYIILLQILYIYLLKYFISNNYVKVSAKQNLKKLLFYKKKFEILFFFMKKNFKILRGEFNKFST